MPRRFMVKEAVNRYLKERKPEISDSTLYNQRSCLRQFTDFCDTEEVERVDDIDPFLISDFRVARSEQVGENTVYKNLVTVRQFIKWCECRNLIEKGIADSIVLPNRDAQAQGILLTSERAKQILNYLNAYEYASFSHALFALLWTTGIRGGTVRALNITDFNKKKKYICVRHRPEYDTPLKNGEKSERDVNLGSYTTDVISDYIEARREQVTDSFGKKPLFTTSQGRVHRTTIRKNIVALTRPCYYSNECPHDRDIEGCEANSYDSASKCPSSISPHRVRRSAIIHWLDKGNSKKLLSDRFDVAVEVLEGHYEARSEERKRKLRGDMFGVE